MTPPNNSMTPAFSPIAIVGVSVLFPGSRGPQEFWTNILEGKDFIQDVPPDHWLLEDYFDPDPAAPEKIYARRGAFLPKVPFDPMRFGLPPTALSATDTVQLLALIVAEKILDDAVSLQFQKVDRSRVSTILGVASATELVGQMAARIQKPHWVKALRESGLSEDQVQDVARRIADTYPNWTENTFPGLLGNVVAGRIANRLDLGGTNCVVDAACASSLAAISMGVQELQLGHSDLVISGGCDALNDTFMFMCFSKTPALSKSGDCRPFSASADGTMLGEGIGMVALRRLADAERDGDKIYGVIRGLGASSDGRAKSIYAPRSEGQSQAVRRAYEQAGYGPDSVELVEAHGTATTAGDAAEFEGLRQVFGPTFGDRRRQVALGSIKAQIGHTKAAAGIASLFKVVMALHHRVLPPTIKVDRPNPKLDIDSSPFYLNTVRRPWVHSPDSARRGSVSSFGFGGSNFHVALEAYPAPREQDVRYYHASAELLLVSDNLTAGLLDRLDEVVAETRRLPLNTVARRTQAAFNPGLGKRLGLLAEDGVGLERLVALARDHIEAHPEAPLFFPNQLYYRSGPPETAVAFLFSGQGSQYLQMGAELAITFPDALAVWDATADLAFEDDLPLHRVVFPPPVFSVEEEAAQAGRLTRTEWAQPAIGAVALSQLALLRRLGVKPVSAGGHSYGELVALHVAGVLSAEDLLRLSRTRGERMAAASDIPGGMTAVVMSVEALAARVEAWQVPVTLANINSPSQVVLAGTLVALEAAEGHLAEEGNSFRRLPVSTGFHSHLVDASVEPLFEAMETMGFAPPSVPVYATATASPYPDKEDEIRRQLAEQLSHPVRFLDQVRRMHDDGARIFLEIGPGSVLTPLVTDGLEGREHLAVAMDQKARDGVSAFWNAVGHLAVAGLDLDYDALWSDFAPSELPDDPEAFSPVTVEINGTNYGKPYPPKEGAAGRPAPNPGRAHPAVVLQPSVSVVMNEAVPVQPPNPSSAASVPAPQVSVADAPAPAPSQVPALAPPTQATVAPLQAPAPSQAQGLVPAPPPPFVAVPASAGPAPLRDPAWHSTLQSMQQNLLEAQKSYQQILTESHLAFLRATETAFQQIGGVAPVAFGQDPTVHPPYTSASAGINTAAGQPQPVYPSPLQASADLRSAQAPEQVAAPAPPPGHDAARALTEAPVHSGGYQAPAASSVMAPSAPAPETLREGVITASVSPPLSMPGFSPEAFERDLLRVVSEKTGYPVSMLTLGMDLESDLGIDSIKRVEILSALQQEYPVLKTQDTARLTALKTLGRILDFTAEQTAALRPAVNGTAAALTAPSEPVAPAFSAEAFESDLLRVVSEKTGYPISMLTLGMDLESDLGIDSIKRVEILSALQQEYPVLKTQDTAELTALKTLGQILDFTAAQSAAPESNDSRVDASISVIANGEAATVEGRVLRAVPAPAVGIAMGGLQAVGPLVLVPDALGVAPALAALLEGAGLDVEVRPDVPEYCRKVVILSGLNDFTGALGRADAIAVNRKAFQMARSLGTRLLEGEGVFVTVQDTGGAFGLDAHDAVRSWSGGLAGLAKTAGREWPAASVKAIDLERGGRSPEELARLIFEELVYGGPENEVGLKADGTRLRLDLQMAADQELFEAAISVVHEAADRKSFEAAVSDAQEAADGESFEVARSPGDVVVVSGGARGVTAACLLALARKTSLRVAILGRTALEPEPPALQTLQTDAELKAALLERARESGEELTPVALNRQTQQLLAAREVRATLGALAALGTEARYLPVDITDAERVGEVLEEVRRDWGPIHAVFHAAGVLADKHIHEKTDEQFDRVFRTKVEGLRNLLDATREDPLHHLCCFSSVAARTGNPGQVDYAMANEVLNKVCQAEARMRGASCVVRSLNWGPWDGGMVHAGLKAHFAAMGVALIDLEAGAEFFVDALIHPASTDVEVVVGGALGEVTGRTSTERSRLWRIDPERYPLLDSHRIQGRHVVPMMMANEWMCRLAKALYPTKHVQAVRRLSVFKGIVLSAAAEPEWFVLTDTAVEREGLIDVETVLSDRSGRPRYRAHIELNDHAPVAPPPPLPLEGLEAWPWEASEVYDPDIIFHGPDFHVIRRLIGQSAEGGVGELRTTEALADPSVSRLTDIGALDGSMQLALLWSKIHWDTPSLPTGFAALQLYRPGPWPETVRCQLVRTEASALMSRGDAFFIDAEGAVLAALEGLEMHAVPVESLAPESLEAGG